MKVKNPVVGGICKSLQGRDKDRYYIIKSINSDGTVELIDGNYRRIAEPKRKNLKHLYLLPEKAEIIAEKFMTEKMVFDTEVYSALKKYNSPAEKDDKINQADNAESRSI